MQTIQDETSTRSTNQPSVSVIVPSWSGETERLRTSLAAQTFQDYELIVVQGVSPAATARNRGVAQSKSETIVFVDDDAYLGNERVLETLVTALHSSLDVGVVGSSKLIPPDASPLQRRIAAEVPRWVFPVVSEDTESNPPIDRYGFTGITTTCCALRRTIFDEVGGFDDRLPTGPEDTEFFYRIRRAGYRFLIPHDCWVYHDPPGRLGELLRKSFHYGIGHAQEVRKAPERHMNVVPLDRWLGKLIVLLSPILFVPSLFVNLYFEPTPHLRFGFRPLKALSTYATLYGYTWEWFRGGQ